MQITVRTAVMRAAMPMPVIFRRKTFLRFSGGSGRNSKSASSLRVSFFAMRLSPPF